jgi:hypothetical protein
LCDTSFVAAKEPGGAFVTEIHRHYGWAVLAGYLSLALAVAAMTPALEAKAWLPPITPLVLTDKFADDAMMQPLRLEANAAMRALQRAPETF